MFLEKLIGSIIALWGIVVLYGAFKKATICKKGQIASGIVITVGGIAVLLSEIMNAPSKPNYGIVKTASNSNSLFKPAFIIVGIGVVIYIFNLICKNKIITVETQEKNKKEEFYKECLKADIKECKNEKEVQKANLIAEKYGIKYSDISDLYYETKELVKKKAQKELDDSLKAKREEERAEQKTLVKYEGITGREKRIAMLTAERAALLQTADTLKSGAKAVMNASQQKEKDWAIHGGIANGIAGPAAGAATALNIQAQNAQIRAQNKANLQAFSPLITNSYMGAVSYESQARGVAVSIDSAKTKLLAKDDVQTCLKRLAFTETKVEVSETGTCTVTTKVALTEPFTIFEDVKAVIDGTIIAKIYDGETLVGTAALVLPSKGIGYYHDPYPLKGMCLYCGKKDRDYRVEFAAVDLWAMEI